MQRVYPRHRRARDAPLRDGRTHGPLATAARRASADGRRQLHLRAVSRAACWRAPGVFRPVLAPDRQVIVECLAARRVLQVPEILWYREVAGDVQLRAAAADVLSRRSVPLHTYLPATVQHASVLFWDLAVRGARPAGVGRVAGAGYAMAALWLESRRDLVKPDARWRVALRNDGRSVDVRSPRVRGPMTPATSRLAPDDAGAGSHEDPVPGRRHQPHPQLPPTRSWSWPSTATPSSSPAGCARAASSCRDGVEHERISGRVNPTQRERRVARLRGPAARRPRLRPLLRPALRPGDAAGAARLRDRAHRVRAVLRAPSVGEAPLGARVAGAGAVRGPDADRSGLRGVPARGAARPDPGDAARHLRVVPDRLREGGASRSASRSCSSPSAGTTSPTRG